MPHNRTLFRCLLGCLPLVLLTGCPAPPPKSASAPGTSSQPGDSGTPKAGPATQTKWGPDDGIPLGGYMSLTGNTSSFGTSSNKAMGLAIEEINAAGGVNGKMLTLYMEDSASQQEEAKNAARRLMEKNKVKVVIGEVASSLSLAVAPDCQQAKIPMVSPSSTNPELTRKGDYIFRTCFTDDQQGAYVATYALTKGYKSGVILRDISSDYSKGQAKVIKQRFEAKGGKIIADEGYEQKQQDFNAVLTKIKPLKPDVIFIPGYYSEVGLIIKQAKEQGIEAAFMGADGWDAPQLKQLAGNLLDKDCYFVNHYSQSEDRPKVKEFVENFKKKYGEAPDALAACAYDAVGVVADAIRRAGSTEPKAIRDALAKTKDYDGVTGKTTINNERNASKSCVVLGFKDGEQVLAATLSPADI